MDFFEMMLPVFVDYLGCFEEGFDGVNTPADVMRELHQRGVQENRYLPGAELVVEDDQLVLRDSPQRMVAERYTLRNLEDPVAFVKKNAHPNDQDLTRVVVFKEVNLKGHYDSSARFHAVQCIDSDPIELVDMVKAAKSRFAMNDEPLLHRQESKNSLDSNWMLGRSASRESSVVNLRKNLVKSGTDSVRSATIRRNGAASSRASLPFRDSMESSGAIPVSTPTPPMNTKQPQHRKIEKKPSVPLVTDQTAGVLGFERPSFQYSISEDPVQKDTILLNYCIDDIERFCAELKLQKSGGGSEAMMDRQWKLRGPRAIDFVNIFQKFKLAFNLLGRLEDFLENPNAVEMLHHLFPPLAFLVDECFELFDEDLVRDVVFPLATPKAVDFLERSLGQREAVIWRALGENWLNPNVRQSHEMVPYSPRFHDGWSPGVISFAFPDDSSFSQQNKRRSTNSNPSISRASYDQQSSSSDESVRRPLSRQQSVLSANETFDAYRDELMSMGTKIGLVTVSRDAQNVKELTVTKGEYLEIVNDKKNWWRCINANGQAGFVPCNFMKVIYYEDGENYRQGGPSSKATVLGSGIHRSSSSKKRKPSRQVSSSDSNDDSHQAPIPPPPLMPQPSMMIPAPPPQPKLNHHQPASAFIRPPPQQKSNNINNSIRSSGQSMQEELRSVLELIVTEEDKTLDIKTTPDVYITQTSSPREVKQWLRDKGFSQRAIEQLSRLDGSRLFAMSRKDLIAAFGKQEGIRLDSQITISRNSAGFQTAKTSELRDILAKARQRTENAKEHGTSMA